MRFIITIIFFVFISQAWGEDCRRAIELYNQGTISSSLKIKEQHFKDAISLCSDAKVLAKAYNNLADTYERGGRISKALIYYRKALEVDPRLAPAYFSVGDIFFGIKDYFSAAAMYKKGLRYEPGDEISLKQKQEAEIKSQRHMLIYFDFDSASISQRYLSRLDVVGKTLVEDKPKHNLMAKVIGHACPIGSNAYNRRLSLRRAKMVANHLKTKFSLN